jgi:hypothetical protein
VTRAGLTIIDYLRADSGNAGPRPALVVELRRLQDSGCGADAAEAAAGRCWQLGYGLSGSDLRTATGVRGPRAVKPSIAQASRVFERFDSDGSGATSVTGTMSTSRAHSGLTEIHVPAPLHNN